MFCKEFIEKISLYIDGYLNEAERERIEKHMEECENCRNIYEDIMTIKIFSPSLKDKYSVESFRKKDRRKILTGVLALVFAILTLFTVLFEYNIIPKKNNAFTSVEKVKKEKIIKTKKKIKEPVKIYYTDMIYEVSYEDIMP